MNEKRRRETGGRKREKEKLKANDGVMHTASCCPIRLITYLNSDLFMQLYFFSLFIILALASCDTPTQGQTAAKPRVIVTTDGEFDDRCSMVRFLLYANEFDVQGIVHSSSKFHWKGTDDIPGRLWNDVSWMDTHLQAYADVYENLLTHHPEFPTPTYLESQVYVGNIDLAGAMEQETSGSNRIVEVLIDPDPSPVWLQAWGGSNTIARALKTIEEKHPEKKKAVEEKAHLFLILLQDTTYESYIASHWPNLPVLLSTSFESIGYPWKKRVPDTYATYYLGEWMNENLLFDHGPLLDIYRKHLYGGDRTSGDFISEGDSPAFMHAIPNGLRSTQDPTWGGWGGRFKREEALWVSAEDGDDIFRNIYRWIPAYQRDFAARADWCVKSYEAANHPPQVQLNGDENRTAKPGDTILLDAAATIDPDNDALSFRWWQYKDADTYAQSVTIDPIDQSTTEVIVPPDAREGDTIHIICEVTDGGSPPLTRYQRVVIHVDEN